MADDLKEVYFDKYCKTCVNKKLKEKEEPCSTCLDNPVNSYSHKPTEYEAK